MQSRVGLLNKGNAVRLETRFTRERLAGLYGRHPGRAPRRNLARLEAGRSCRASPTSTADARLNLAECGFDLIPGKLPFAKDA
jgi:hypothetical protein